MAIIWLKWNDIMSKNGVAFLLLFNQTNMVIIDQDDWLVAYFLIHYNIPRKDFGDLLWCGSME